MTAYVEEERTEAAARKQSRLKAILDPVVKRYRYIVRRGQGSEERY